MIMDFGYMILRWAKDGDWYIYPSSLAHVNLNDAHKNRQESF